MGGDNFLGLVGRLSFRKRRWIRVGGLDVRFRSRVFFSKDTGGLFCREVKVEIL